MLEKLLSVLPYNPSVVRQLSFYSKRMRAEKSLRRIGVVFIGLAFLVQFFAFISPPQPTVADSPNDLVNGGFSSAAEAANDCSSNLFGYGTILANYGITCAKVASATTLTINSRDWNNQLFSMGRLPYNIAGETPIGIGGTTYYARYLWGWDSPGTSSTYQALNVTSIGGQTFLLLFACGNLTSVGFPSPVPPPVPPPPPPPPAPAPPPPPVCPIDTAILKSSSSCVACSSNSTIIASNSECKSCEQAISSEDDTACVQISKKAANLTQGTPDATTTDAQAGDLIQYTLYADNAGTETVKNYTFTDNLSYILDYSSLVSNSGGTLDANNDISWPAQDIKPMQTVSEQFEVRVDNPIPQTPTSTSDPNFFNLTMTNTYGNTIKINLPASPAKVIETTTTALPNTGPGNSLIFGAVVVAIAGFFFYRSRILMEESSIAVKESIVGGL